MNSPQWPVREPNEAIEIVSTQTTSTHIIEYTSDRVICLQVKTDTHLPEMVEKTKHLPGYLMLSEVEIEEAYRLIHAS